ncbi:ferric-chelate reductase 1-like isoform X2 [Montipora foliosa]|uniref:ferric-chelate reductase 1-like isoform X2 n=1 Tax=Montipora foliosa TaxID=591990 RepID=UPI0035F14B6E
MLQICFTILWMVFKAFALINITTSLIISSLVLFSSIVLLFLFSSTSHGLTFNTDDCNNGKGCFFSPDSCTTSENCDFLITFNATNSTTVLFEADTDLLMCVRGDGSRSGHYYASSQAPPLQTTPTPSAVTVIAQTFESGRMNCRVSREINPGLTNFKDLNTSLFLIGGYGPLDSGGGIEQHDTLPLSSPNRLRVTEAGRVMGDDPFTTSMLVHGILMAIAWTMFAFVGLFTARYMREVWEPTEIFGKKAWFTVHRLLMTTTVSLTIAGTIVIFVHVGGWSSGDGAHPICGIIAISLAVIQPIMAAFRPAPDAPKRGIFNWTHRLVGIIALVMAVVAIYLGLDRDRVKLGKPGLYAVITFYIGEFLIFVFEFYLIMSKRNKAKKTDTGDIAMHPPGYETQQQPEMSPKEAMLRKMMFAFVTLLGFSVTLTIILLLVLRYQGAVDFSEEN